MTYSEKLKHPKFQKFRLRILEAANWKCEDCGCGDNQLSVHHTAYITGKEPWEYPSDLVMSVCSRCHKKRQKLEDAIRINIGKMTRFMTLKEIESEVWEMVEQMSIRQTNRYAKAFGP